MNFKKLNIINDGFILEAFINEKNKIVISVRDEDDSFGNIISLNFDDAIALRDELSILLDEMNSGNE